jgi:hypothetical protein
MALRPLLLALLAVAAASGCRLDPDGRCDARADCPAGLDCLNHVCASCRGDSDCWSHTACSAAGLCEPRANRCWVDADCEPWNECDATRTCVLRSGRCVDDTSCGAIAWCDPEHNCSLRPGRCNADADCAAWMAGCDEASQTCSFSVSAGDDVVAWGTLAEGLDDRFAAARVTAPTQVEVGFDAGSGGAGSGLVDPATGDLVHRGFIDPVTGDLVYRHVGDVDGDTLRRLNRDAITQDLATGLWTYPDAPSTDDEVAIAAEKCPRTWDRWIMQGGTGTGSRPLLYGCPTYAGWDFYASGASTPKLTGVRGLFAWNGNGYLLVKSAGGVLQVVSSTGTATAVSGLPAGTHLAYRTTADAWVNAPGFRVALRRDDDGADELWEIGEVTATAALAGGYPAVPGAYAGPTWELIDQAGALYGRAYVGTAEVILKRPLSGATTTAVYSELAMPSGSNDFSAATFKPFLRLDQSFLLSRP